MKLKIYFIGRQCSVTGLPGFCVAQLRCEERPCKVGIANKRTLLRPGRECYGFKMQAGPGWKPTAGENNDFFGLRGAMQE